MRALCVADAEGRIIRAAKVQAALRRRASLRDAWGRSAGPCPCGIWRRIWRRWPRTVDGQGRPGAFVATRF